ncbi:hypothetical protein F8M41_024782 [Gigaspora margarita]|uniref:Uncharacterized protein n=1 Tax=Gigaspora margarita TaxID=4874 RepID=A0A8H4ABI2_GIGMA|nr:hypothetical protein F8M41_024782 [Gigaspora margarita]
MNKYEDKRKEEEKDLSNDRIGVVEIEKANEMNIVGPCYEKGIEVEMDEIMEDGREEESGVKKDEKDNKPNENDNEEYDDDETIVDEENIEEFRRKNDFKKTKGPTEIENTEIEETLYEIEVEKNEDKGAVKIGKKEAQTVFLVQF